MGKKLCHISRMSFLFLFLYFDVTVSNFRVNGTVYLGIEDRTCRNPFASSYFLVSEIE